ncbi:unnamed protein product, partial [Polarella glacialis]
RLWVTSCSVSAAVPVAGSAPPRQDVSRTPGVASALGPLDCANLAQGPAAQALQGAALTSAARQPCLRGTARFDARQTASVAWERTRQGVSELASVSALATTATRRDLSAQPLATLVDALLRMPLVCKEPERQALARLTEAPVDACRNSGCLDEFTSVLGKLHAPGPVRCWRERVDLSLSDQFERFKPQVDHLGVLDPPQHLPHVHAMGCDFGSRRLLGRLGISSAFAKGAEDESRPEGLRHLSAERRLSASCAYEIVVPGRRFPDMEFSGSLSATSGAAETGFRPPAPYNNNNNNNSNNNNSKKQ